MLEPGRMGNDPIADPHAGVAVREDEESRFGNRVDHDYVLVAAVVAPLPEILVSLGALDAPAQTPAKSFSDLDLLFAVLRILDRGQNEAGVVRPRSAHGCRSVRRHPVG